MMGEIVTRNMQSKAIANKERNCCILLDLFHQNQKEMFNSSQTLSFLKLEFKKEKKICSVLINTMTLAQNLQARIYVQGQKILQICSKFSCPWGPGVSKCFQETPVLVPYQSDLVGNFVVPVISDLMYSSIKSHKVPGKC